LSTRDNAPEATREMLEKEAPGIVEFVRLMTFKKDPSIALTRGVAGARGKTLIVNLPAAQAAVTALEVALPLIPEALQSILGQTPVETASLRRA
nr:MogA/MoaB family molybdenum cofactor biosynthesis protein [Thermaceae bacterium]